VRGVRGAHPGRRARAEEGVRGGGVSYGAQLPKKPCISQLTKVTPSEAIAAVKQPEILTPPTILAPKRKMIPFTIRPPMPSVRDLNGTVTAPKNPQATALRMPTTNANASAEPYDLTVMPGSSLATTKTLTAESSRWTAQTMRWGWCMAGKLRPPRRSRKAQVW